MKNTLVLLPLLFFLAGESLAQQNVCPRIYKVQDTLKTDPAPSYQWYKNGALIPNADKIWFRPTESGDYTVAVGATSVPKSVTLNPADLRVEVFDKKLKPVTNATVSVNGQTTTTDANGRAFLTGVVSGRTVVKVTQNDYFDGYSSVYKPASGNAIVKIQLEKFPSALTFQDTARATVAAPSGLNLTFPPHAFKIESTGEAYNGEVKIYFNHRAPENDPMFSFAMPGGDFTAINSNGETVALTSYGFFNAELRGENGEELNLKSGVTADVQFRIPEAMRAAAPDVMPLWSFDEAAGTWKYDSELAKHGIYYKGNVSHFSSWNCDYQGPACTVIASAKDCNGNPASGVTICFVSGVCGVTDSNGQITFANIPANQALVLVSNQDTINLAPINVDETFTLSEPILAGETMLAVADYWQDSVEVLVFGEQPPVQYSLDGQNWQTESLFTNVPFQDSIMVWTKDASGCPIIQNVFYTRSKENVSCITAESSAEANLYFTNFQNLMNWGKPTLYSLYGANVAPPLFEWAINRYPCLYELNVNNCSFETLSLEIGNLTGLRDLSLWTNQLTALPAEIGNLNNLSNLELRYNQLTSLPSEIGNLTNLISFDLGGNQLAVLPAEIGNLTNLTYLSLDINQLTVLPAEIGNLTNLNSLGIYNNLLTALPNEIGSLTNLKGLSLGKNQISALPHEIGNLINLEYLNLSRNKVLALPAEIGNLTKLKVLDLAFNNLTALPAEIGNLTNLTSLNLFDNQLTALPPEIANLANTLQEISLWGNSIPVGDRPYYQSLLPNTYITW